MTKLEHKLKSMLNYYEVDLNGIKDEKMDKKSLNKFLDKFNQFMDYYILQEIISKIKSKRDDKEKFEEEDDEIDPMLNSNFGSNDSKDKMNNDEMSTDDTEFDNFENMNNPIETDINKFLKWLTLMLYSGEHSVIITEDKSGINIRLVKINKGKK
jgi:hypothetical protein